MTDHDTKTTVRVNPTAIQIRFNRWRNTDQFMKDKIGRAHECRHIHGQAADRPLSTLATLLMGPQIAV